MCAHILEIPTSQKRQEATKHCNVLWRFLIHLSNSMKHVKTNMKQTHFIFTTTNSYYDPPQSQRNKTTETTDRVHAKQPETEMNGRCVRPKCQVVSLSDDATGSLNGRTTLVEAQICCGLETHKHIPTLRKECQEWNY